MNAPGNRRSFLGGIAAAVTMAPAVAIAAAPAKAAPILEAPELLAVGEQLPALLETYRGALKRRDEAVARFEQQCLPIPPDLVLPPPSPQMRWSDYCEITRENVNFLACKRIDDKRVYDAKALKIHIIQQEVPRTTKEGRRLRRLARIATKFEKDRDAALKTCGYLGAEEACSDAAYEIERLAIAAVNAPLPRTRHGVEILARMTSAIGEIIDEAGNGITLANKAGALGRRLADATMSVEVAR